VSDVDLTELDPERLPKHLAIIMDGNGRWAKANGLNRVRGHEAGAKSVRSVTEMCRELNGINTLSLYAFSNWRRSNAEVSALFALLSKYIKLEIENLHAENIRIKFMGRTEGLAKTLLAEMRASEEKTKDNTAMTLNLAVNYGSRSEILDACKSIVHDVERGILAKDDIDEQAISDRLYLPETQDLDLLIRTSGEMRLSNFMLWQLSYAEIVVTDTYWPDFHKPQLMDALREYQSRKRNFGART
jgi:undecaprenyl diphosphate synthase